MPRKEKKYHFIYKTTNLINGKYYYGMHSTNNLNDGYYGSGKRLRYSINKYGKDNHIVEKIEFFDNRKDLIKKEKEIVTLNEITKSECMNIMVGGQGGFISEEQQRYRAICAGKAFANKLKNDSEFREKHKRIVSENMKKSHLLGKIKYDTFTGRKHTKETRQIIGEKSSINQKGEKNSQYGTCWITNGIDNRKIKKEKLPLLENTEWIKGRT